MRWQPWFYQYFFMLAALGFYAWKKPEAKNNRVALDCCALIVVCTYFWSGIQKLNASFIHEVWPDMTAPLLRFLPGGLKGLPPEERLKGLSAEEIEAYLHTLKKRRSKRK